MTDRRLAQVLDEIEKREQPLLSWGITDAFIEEDELLELLEKIQPADDPEDLLDQLLDQHLLVTVGMSGDRFRSRMAETVRLASGLRQWFPGGDWRTAPPLVSDLRFLSRARVVPRRDLTPDALVDKLSSDSSGILPPTVESALLSVLGEREVSGFQARSAARLLADVNSTAKRGTCITAGTGAGKTLAFYLPAITRLLTSTSAAAVPRVVAVYPRTELLRDQLRNVLLTLRNVKDGAAEHIRVGVLYGATPRNRSDAENSDTRGWKSRTDGVICPILTCLEEECSGSYLWPKSAGEQELLICLKCGRQLTSLSFVRDRMQIEPPEMLFTSTEMANRHIGPGKMQKLFVGDRRASPEYLLLDEIHTYGGIHGAQVANLLRRWRAAMSSPCHIVGLSATLADPLGFFAQLTGLSPANVAVVVPADDEMKELGREYFIALRGDPASQKSLLSTTIQTSMLMRRMLDPEPGLPSNGAFGTRLFVFTDKLDVVNRLHTQLQDAEGWRAGGVDRIPRGSLALLRAGGADARARDEAGQLWSASEELGTLRRSVRVSRTSSRDAGVDAASDIVVATASLEVGFDDPDVGAVLQHKAPRDAAQFLQRRGRAGRDPSMRPWTVVVLSDYGRDRLAFQSYESLFDPVVRPMHLPIKNRVVLKMQATWWLLDNLGRAHSGARLKDVIAGRGGSGRRTAAEHYLREARDLLTEQGIDRFAGRLQRSLDLTDDEVRSVLWDHPRALVTAVVPTIIRRLQTVASSDQLPEGFAQTDPLPGFVPGALFKSLQTPETELQLPHGGNSRDNRETESISQALREFAPGRVNYRFSLRGRRERMWVTPPEPDEPELALEDFVSDFLDLEVPPGSPLTRLVQPRAIALTQPPGEVSDSSYGSWQWCTAFRHDGTPMELDRPTGTAWEPHILAVDAMSHRYRSPLTVWRYASRFDVERRDPAAPEMSSHNLTQAGATVGVGFSMDVDALVVECSLPADIEGLASTPGVLRALRVAYLEHLISTSELFIETVPSQFLRNWLSQILLSALLVESDGRPVGEFIEDLSDHALQTAMSTAAREVFGASPLLEEEAGSQPDPGLVQDIEAAVSEQEVISELRRLSEVLMGEPADSWLPWIHNRYLATLAAALTDAIQTSCPEVDIDDLRPDVEILLGEDGTQIGRVTLSEDQPGGTGVVEAAIDRYVDDPRTFWSLVSSALGPCAGERVDATVRSFLAARLEKGELLEADAVRSAAGLQGLTTAWMELRGALFQSGLDSDQTVISALATRLFRAGSGENDEQLVSRLLELWDAAEESLGIEVDLRVFAYLAIREDEVRSMLSTATAGVDGHSSARMMGQVVSLLWTRGSRLRAASLQNYNPYCELLPTERLLFSHISQPTEEFVDCSDESWRSTADERLRCNGGVVLRCVDAAMVSRTIREVLIEPTYVDVLELHPRVVGVRRVAAGFDLTVELREARQ